jgi:hypothetical protein
MKKILILTLALLSFSALANAQAAADFRIIDYVKGYDQPHPADKQMKINVMKKVMPLTIYDFNKDGVADTLLYKMSANGGQIGTIQVYDPKEDDWIRLYRMDLKGYSGEDGVWFYQLNTANNGEPLLLIYTGRKDHKFLTIIKYDMAAKKYVSKDYDLNIKNLFPHKYAVNKKKIMNQNGANSAEKESYDDIPTE